MFKSWHDANTRSNSNPRRNAPDQERRQSADSNADLPRSGYPTSNSSAYAHTRQNQPSAQYKGAFGNSRPVPARPDAKANTPASAHDSGRHAGPPPPPRPQAPTARRPDPVEPFRARSRNEVPYAQSSSRTSSPYSTQPGERTYFTSDHLRRSESVRDASKSFFAGANGSRGTEVPPRRRSVSAMSANGRNEADLERKPRDHKPTSFTVGSSDDERDQSSAAGGRAADTPGDGPEIPKRPMAKPSRIWSRRHEKAANMGPTDPSEPFVLNGGRQPFSNDGSSMSVDHFEPRTICSHTDPISFHMPLEKDTFATTSTKFQSSPANIDLQFTSTSAPSPFSFFPPPPFEPKQRDSDAQISHPFRGRDDRQGAESSIPGEVPLPKTSQTPGFVQDWSQNLQNGNWVAGISTDTAHTFTALNTPGGGRRLKSRTSRTKSGKVYAVPPPFAADEQDDLQRTTSAASQASRDSNAMDIDPTPLATPPPTNASPSRPIPQANFQRTFQQAVPGGWPENIGTDFRVPPPPSVPPPSGRRASHPFTQESVRSAPSSGPPAPSNIFPSLADLSADLPPPPPRNDFILSSAPAAPLAPLGDGLTATTWQAHVHQMAAYLRHYYTWDVELTRRLADTAPKLLRLSGGATAWLGGGPSQQSAWEEYVEALRVHDGLRQEIAQDGRVHMDAVHRHLMARQEAERRGFGSF